ncbi:MAG: hypothetical protein ACRCSP_07050 [Rhodoglobus sp.]
MGKFSPTQIQAAQEYWPYRTKTKELAGVWGALRQATSSLPPAVLGKTLLEPYAGITDRFDEAVRIVNVDPGRPTRVLQDVITCEPSGFRFTW